MVGDDTWAGLADRFADDAYASVKGQVRTYVLHQQLLEHLPEPPASVLDVGGGAGHQSLPLAQAGYDVMAAFDATTEMGVLGVPTRPDTVEHLSELMRGRRDPYRQLSRAFHLVGRKKGPS